MSFWGAANVVRLADMADSGYFIVSSGSAHGDIVSSGSAHGAIDGVLVEIATGDARVPIPESDFSGLYQLYLDHDRARYVFDAYALVKQEKSPDQPADNVLPDIYHKFLEAYVDAYRMFGAYDSVQDRDFATAIELVSELALRSRRQETEPRLAWAVKNFLEQHRNSLRTPSARLVVDAACSHLESLHCGKPE